MVQKQNVQDLASEEQKAMQQSITQDQQRALQEGVPDGQRAIQEEVRPHYPTWPTSVPGPWETPPPEGMRPVANAMRREQVLEIAYNQETGEPRQDRSPDVTGGQPQPYAQSYDQQEVAQRQTGQELLGKRKQRL
ncbi:MAG TPA: hypothetical protein VFB60_18275 [Ktedonobacteraceae bacterium]|nr:hypothetical protein [Ktedonobacteraceae bacterium]